MENLGQNINAQSVVQNLRDHGFIYLESDGKFTNEMDEFYSKWRKFFELPDHLKTKYIVDVYKMDGYFPNSFEHTKENKVIDYKESYQINKNARLPTNHAHISNNMYKRLTNISKLILEWLELYYKPSNNLNLNFNELLDTNEMSLLRTIYYPIIPKEKLLKQNLTRCGEHQDICLFTIMPKPTSNGVILYNRKGQQISLPHYDGKLLVIVGEMLELLTNGDFKATTHYVPKPSTKDNGTRLACAYFAHAKPETVISNHATAGDIFHKRMQEIGVR